MNADEQTVAYRLVQRLAAMDPIVFLNSGIWNGCHFCAAEWHQGQSDKDVVHRPDCLWLLARQLVEQKDQLAPETPHQRAARSPESPPPPPPDENPGRPVRDGSWFFWRTPNQRAAHSPVTDAPDREPGEPE